MRFVIAICILLIFKSSVAQTNNLQAIENKFKQEKNTNGFINNDAATIKIKPHFILHFNSNASDSISYYKAVSYFPRLNQFRYFNKRRRIYFDDNSAYLELYSVKEMESIYGKKINSYTNESTETEKLKFHYENGMIKEIR
jgi:hypothetical protein